MSKLAIENDSNQSLPKVKFGPVTLDSISKPRATVVTPSKDSSTSDWRASGARMSHASVAATSNASAKPASTASANPAKCPTYGNFDPAEFFNAGKCAAEIDAAITNYEQLAQFVGILNSQSSPEAQELNTLLLRNYPDLTMDQELERYVEWSKRMRSDLINSLTVEDLQSLPCPCAACDHFGALFTMQPSRNNDHTKSTGALPRGNKPETCLRASVRAGVGIASAALKWSGPEENREGVVWTQGLSRVTEHIETILGIAVPLGKLSPRKNGPTNILHPTKASSSVKPAKLPTVTTALGNSEQHVKESISGKDSIQPDRNPTSTSAASNKPLTKTKPRVSSQRRKSHVKNFEQAIEQKSKKQGELEREVAQLPYFQAGAEMLAIAWHLEDLKTKRKARKQK